MDQDTLNLITIIIATYGAVLSTINSITKWNRDKPRLKLTLSIGSFSRPNNDWSEPLLFINILNPGKAKININKFILQDEEGGRFGVLNPAGIELPYVIEERKTASIYFTCSHIRENHSNKKIKYFIIGDETSKVWKVKFSRKIYNRCIKSEDKGVKLLWNEAFKKFHFEDQSISWINPFYS